METKNMSSENVNHKRRRVLSYATVAVAAFGAGFLGVPFVKSWMPSQRAKSAGAPVEVDLSKLSPGELLRVEWQGKPVWVLNRTEAMLERLQTSPPDALVDPTSKSDQQPPYAQNEFRSIKPEYLILVGICTHLGCSPTFRPEVAPADLGPAWRGGFFCACHGSRFDLAGRVFKNLPAPINLLVPDHYYKTENSVIVGLSGEGA